MKKSFLTLLAGYDFNVRCRFQAVYVLSRHDAPKSTQVKVSDEIMINAGRIIRHPFDQNRVYAGVEQELNETFSVELGYLHWYQQRPSG